MKMQVIILLLITIALLSGCRENKIVNLELFKGDWLSPMDKRFFFVEDSLSVQDIIYSSKPVVKYKISNDSLFIYTKDWEYDGNDNQSDLTWKYKILNLDSANLTLLRLFPVKKDHWYGEDTLSFIKTGLNKKNDLNIKELEFSTTGCRGQCPALDIKITSDSLLYLCGYNMYTKHKGLHIYKLDSLEFSRIQNKLNAIDRDSIYFESYIPDIQIIALYINSVKDSVVTIGGMYDIHTSLSNFIFYLESLDYILDLQPCNDKSVSFRDKRNIRLYQTD